MTVENEAKRDWLLRYRWALKRRNEAADELRELLHVGARALDYDPQPAGSGAPHGLETFAVRAEKYYEAEKAAAEYCWKVRAEINAALSALNNEGYAQVLTYRYLVHTASPYERANQLYPTVPLTWQEIAERCYLSFDRVTHLHGEAMLALSIPTNRDKE